MRELAEHGQVPTHQLLLDLEGGLLGSTITIVTPPLVGPIAVAAVEGADLRTIDVDGERIRVRTEQVALDGVAIGYVQAFHSLESRDDTASALAQMFLIAGGIGSAVALVAGYWLSGRTLAPIQRNMEAQERFVADASHELRTPIAVVQSSADVLLRHPDHSVEQEREVVEGIAEEALRMGALVRDLLELGTIDQAPLERRPVELGEIAAGAVQALETRTRERGMRMVLEPGTVWALGDRAALAQVARILLDNAIKYAGEGSRVEVSVAVLGRQARLRVADDGPGIPLEEQDRVFERFARVDKARARAQGSSGLGLSIARAIVERQGGRIVLASTPGEGAAFTVLLPSDTSASAD
ncbi:MAG: Signal transduction histidine kinase [Chloroflexi bacterium]|nr:MAG: Signal transduction histidine kinase [Chloroflexota bacterium]